MDPEPEQEDEPKTINRYVYVLNDPSNRIDPEGREGLLSVAMVVNIGNVLANIPTPSVRRASGTHRHIVVTIADQTLRAYEGAAVKYAFQAATGSSDHPTTKGVFAIFRKNRVYRSKKYNAQ